MSQKKILIRDFYPMRPLENYQCDTLTIVAAARNAFLPELNPFNYEIGIFSINFDYDHGQLVPVEKINNSNLREWKDFNYLFELQPDNEYDEMLLENFGLKYIKNKAKDVPGLLGQVGKHLEIEIPVIVGCNAYHLFYTEYYQKTPGGMFGDYHHVVVYGISPGDNQVWIYDPTLENFNGDIPFSEFTMALEDERGIENFEGLVYYTFEYNGKEFDDINRELLLWALHYYINDKGKRIKEKLLEFFNDFTHYYYNLPLLEYKNKLLEFGFFIFRILFARRLHWHDFFDYYKNLEERDDLQEDIDAFKTNVDRLFTIPTTFYANSLKENKKLNLEGLKARLEQAMIEEEHIFHRLYKKIK
jgi:hypothetical protein